MMKKESLRDKLFSPKAWLYSFRRRTAKFWPDKLFLKSLFKERMGYSLNLENPRTFSEKLQWLKLYDRRPEYTTMVDKYEVKEYVKSIIGEEYIIPTLGVWNSVDDIDFENLPNQFVLKCTHDSGGFVICKDKSNLNIDEVKAKLKKCMKRNYFWQNREYPYKNITPRIIAEKYMSDDSEFNKGGLSDYKFTCFNGNVDNVMVCVDRHLNDTKFYFFNKDWMLLPLNVRGKNTDPSFKLPKPECMDEMFEIASKLSENIPFLRVDLYYINGRPFFGETTFFPSSGFDPNILPETEILFGSKIELKK